MTNIKNDQLAEEQLVLPQPKALYLLFFVQMWESFSFYGMRAILVLYMISALAFTDTKAFGVYAVFVALSECLGVFGGRIADKILGLRPAIYLGGMIIALGHFILSIPIDGHTLYLGLACISVGTGLFRTNCTALLGEFYGENDPRRDAGYTLFYVGLNVGAFLATILCVLTAEAYGWHYGFSLAAFGMLLGLLALLRFSYILEGKGKKPKTTNKKKLLFTSVFILVSTPIFGMLIYSHQFSAYLLLLAIIVMFFSVFQAAKRLPHQTKENIKSILILIVLLAIFYGFEEQIGTSIVVFANRFANKNFLGMEVPVATLTTFNPLTILLLGSLVAIFFGWYERKFKRHPNIFSKISLAFLLQASAFALLYSNIIAGEQVSSYVIAAVVGIIAFSELFIGPAVYAYCSEFAPKHMKGMLMGSVMLGYSLANLLSGFLSQYMAIDDINQTDGIDVYADGFLKIMLVCLITSAIVYIIKIFRNKRSST